MTSKFLLILGIGHVLGNFYFQTDKISEEKDKSFKGVIIHAIEYTLSVFLVMLPFINMGLIKWGLLYSVSHFAIDAIKYKLLKDEKRLNHKTCGIWDSGHSSSGSCLTASGRSIHHPDSRTPVCEES